MVIKRGVRCQPQSVCILQVMKEPEEQIKEGRTQRKGFSALQCAWLGLSLSAAVLYLCHQSK